ncbi:hypothetical protein pb186bvf_014231 [Paramecium bursaria]
MRRTYHPGKTIIEIPNKRMVNSTGRGASTEKTPSIKPIDPLTNFRIFLYKTKQHLEYKAASQFTRYDPMLKEQPIFVPSQLPKDNAIKFQAYLDGELSADEYLKLINFRKLYKNIRSDRVDQWDDDFYQVEKESALKKLKERIIHRHRMGKHKKRPSLHISKTEDRSPEKSVHNDPKQHLANELKKYLIQKHFNVNDLQKFQKSLNSIKIVKELNNANDQFQRNSENKDLITQYYHRPYFEKGKQQIRSTKQIKIIRSIDKIEKTEEISSYNIRREFSQHIVKSSVRENTDCIKTDRPKVLRFEEPIPQINQKAKVEMKSEQEQLEVSANSSLYSQFEQNIGNLYDQSMLLQKHIKQNQNEGLSKRIRAIQSVYQINSKVINACQSRLY